MKKATNDELLAAIEIMFSVLETTTDLEIDMNFSDLLEGLEGIPKDDTIRRRGLEMMINDFDYVFRDNPKAFREVQSEIRQRLNLDYHSLGRGGLPKIVRSALSKGKISDEVEYYAIMDIVSNSEPSEMFTADEVEKLESLVELYETNYPS